MSTKFLKEKKVHQRTLRGDENKKINKVGSTSYFMIRVGLKSFLSGCFSISLLWATWSKHCDGKFVKPKLFKHNKHYFLPVGD